MASGRGSERAFFGVSALLFAANAVVTIVWCVSMPAVGETDARRRWRAVLIAIGVAVLKNNNPQIPRALPIDLRYKSDASSP